MKKKLSLVLIALLCLGMLTACNQGFYCNYCGFDELISGEENRMVIGSVDIDLCDKHKSEFLEGTESISVDDLLGRLDTNEAVKVRSVGGDTDTIKTEDGYAAVPPGTYSPTFSMGVTFWPRITPSRSI